MYLKKYSNNETIIVVNLSVAQLIKTHTLNQEVRGLNLSPHMLSFKKNETVTIFYSIFSFLKFNMHEKESKCFVK